jgi:phage repressor protein C with HTH and peptisase S24 domain
MTDEILRRGDGVVATVFEGLENRIDEAARVIGDRQTAANVMGVSAAQLYRYLKGEAVPPLSAMISLARRSGLALEWLATGEGPMRPGEAGAALPMKPGDYIYVPVYEVGAAAGSGVEVGEERIVDFLAFRTWFIHQELRANPKDLAVLWVFGDSMEPTLSDGDVVLVDRSKTELNAEALYVLRRENMLLIKRVQAGAGPLFLARSDNPDYQPLEFRMSDVGKEIHVIGRVVWAGKRI